MAVKHRFSESLFVQLIMFRACLVVLFFHSNYMYMFYSMQKNANKPEINVAMKFKPYLTVYIFGCLIVYGYSFNKKFLSF